MANSGELVQDECSWKSSVAEDGEEVAAGTVNVETVELMVDAPMARSAHTGRTEHNMIIHGTMKFTSAAPRWEASRNRLGLCPVLLIMKTEVPERCRRTQLPRPVKRLEDVLSEQWKPLIYQTATSEGNLGEHRGT